MLSFSVNAASTYPSFHRHPDSGARSDHFDFPAARGALIVRLADGSVVHVSDPINTNFERARAE